MYVKKEEINCEILHIFRDGKFLLSDITAYIGIYYIIIYNQNYIILLTHENHYQIWQPCKGSHRAMQIPFGPVFSTDNLLPGRRVQKL